MLSVQNPDRNVGMLYWGVILRRRLSELATVFWDPKYGNFKKFFNFVCFGIWTQNFVVWLVFHTGLCNRWVLSIQRLTQHYSMVSHPTSVRGTAFGTRCDTTHHMAVAQSNSCWLLYAILKAFYDVSCNFGYSKQLSWIASRMSDEIWEAAACRAAESAFFADLSQESLGCSSELAWWFRHHVTWLILPVVICLSQRLSHACLSISVSLRNCEWLIKTVIVSMSVVNYLDIHGNSRANTCVQTRLLRKGCAY